MALYNLLFSHYMKNKSKSKSKRDFCIHFTILILFKHRANILQEKKYVGISYLLEHMAPKHAHIYIRK